MIASIVLYIRAKKIHIRPVFFQRYPREESRDKIQREAAFYSGGACENTAARRSPAQTQKNTVIHEYLDDSHSARLSRVPLFMDVT